MKKIKLTALFCLIFVVVLQAQRTKTTSKLIKDLTWVGKTIKGRPVKVWNVYNREKKLVRKVFYIDKTVAIVKYIGYKDRITEVSYCYIDPDNPFNLIGNGPDTSFYPNGKLEAARSFVNNKAEGLNLYFNELGDTLGVWYFKHGEYDGEYTTFFNETKKIQEHGFYADGKRTGLWVEYYPSGKPKSQGEFYPKGLWIYNTPANYRLIKDSLNRSYLDTTFVMFPHMQFFKNKKWSYWTEDGKLFLEEWWQNGKYLHHKFENVK